jgi:hypothetical protein
MTNDYAGIEAALILYFDGFYDGHIASLKNFFIHRAICIVQPTPQ